MGANQIHAHMERKESIINLLNNEAKRHATIAQDRLNLISEDIVNGLPWYGEDMFKAKVTEKMYRDAISEINDIKSYISKLDSFLNSESNVRALSTGSLHRETATWKYEVILTVRNALKAWTTDI